MVDETKAAEQNKHVAATCDLPRSYTILYRVAPRRREEGEAAGVTTIRATSRRQLELLLLCLDEEAAVVMGEEARNKEPDLADWLEAREHGTSTKFLKWERGEEDDALKAMKGIPMPPRLGESSLQLRAADPSPERISRRLVHKAHNENVLLSTSDRCGNMFYFNGFADSSEFQIDHPSDHVEGIVLFEAARQCGIATAHLSGIPESSRMILLRSAIHYKSFVEREQPYLLRSVTAIACRGTYVWTMFQILQGGRSCAYGYFAGFLFNDRDAYRRIRAASAARPDAPARSA